MNTEKVRILDHPSVMAKLKRMAFQIYEKNFETDELVFAGVDRRGGHLAKVLIGLLNEISPLSIQYVSFSRKSEGAEIQPDPSFSKESVSGKTVVLVDDVLYSGKTMMQALSFVNELEPAAVRVAVLIDRGHHNYPLTPDYMGLDLATTLRQHVSVEVSEQGELIEAFLI